MEQFTLTSNLIRRLARNNCFPIPENTLVFFGLRYVFPSDLRTCQDFQEGHEMISFEEAEMEERRFRKLSCTLGQWDTHNNTIAIFPGSTVPYLTDLQKHSDEQGRKNIANMLMPGFFEYKHQLHNGDYPAFGLKKGKQPIRRSNLNTRFGFDEADDSIEVADPGNNIHASSCNAETKTHSGKSQYFSAGCQVIAGWGRSAYWKERITKFGPFDVFQKNADKRSQQQSFWYMLLDGADAKRAATSQNNMPLAKLQFGSRDISEKKLVTALQQFLAKSGADVGQSGADGIFGGGTFKAIRNLQKAEGLPTNGIAIVQKAEDGGLDFKGLGTWKNGEIVEGSNRRPPQTRPAEEDNRVFSRPDENNQESPQSEEDNRVFSRPDEDDREFSQP